MPSCHSHQVSGSTSASVTSRPATDWAWSTLVATIVDHSTEKIGSRSASFHGAVTSSTSWPSSCSSAAASRAPFSAIGSSSLSIGMSKVSAILSLPGSRRMVSANGSGGGGAHDASPVSGPAIRSSITAASSVVRVTTPFCTR